MKPSLVFQFEGLDERSYGLLFAVRRSIRYHDRRRAWFDGWHNVTLFLSFFGSSAAAAVVLGAFPKFAAVAASAMVALLATMDLVIGFARKAALHNMIKLRFIDLEKIMPIRNFSPEEYQSFRGQRLEIEKDELPVMRLLDFLCHYQQSRADGVEPDSGEKKKFLKICLWRKFTVQIWSHENYVTKFLMCEKSL